MRWEWLSAAAVLLCGVSLSGAEMQWARHEQQRCLAVSWKMAATTDARNTIASCKSQCTQLSFCTCFSISRKFGGCYLTDAGQSLNAHEDFDSFVADAPFRANRALELQELRRQGRTLGMEPEHSELRDYTLRPASEASLVPISRFSDAIRSEGVV